MKNKFNKLTSKEWLPFQKSWFRYESDEQLYRENIRFFAKLEDSDVPMLYYGNKFDLFTSICKENGIRAELIQGYTGNSQFIFMDLRSELESMSINDYNDKKSEWFNLLKTQFDGLEYRRFVSVVATNVQHQTKYLPYAWDLAKEIGHIYSIKDEKIGCQGISEEISPSSYFKPLGNTFYCLYFRKDELSLNSDLSDDYRFLKVNNEQIKRGVHDTIPSWFIPKPQPRSKAEILHPAKYPEDVVKFFVQAFSEKDDNVFDPMSGTGSTQMSALMLERNGYGTELSDFFASIANERCKEYINPSQLSLFDDGHSNHNKFRILNKDARKIDKTDFPEINLMVTSPPYWDMLNMKGAENQAKRIEKGLRTNYSDDTEDIGNIADYNTFIETLREIYFNVASLMSPGSYMTIIVKNIKKKGSNYPFAWDLSNVLQEKLILLPEVFWCQDDITIAPYGYGNTWVSNTFHQYCLTFQVPEDFSK